MAAEVVAAVIGAVGTIGAGVIGSVLGQRKGRKEERTVLEFQSQASAKSLQEQLAQRFGLRAASATSKMTVLNTNGDASVIRKWRGLRVGEGQSVAQIPGVYWVTTPGGRIKSGPELLGADSFPKHVSLQKLVQTESQCRFRLEVVGSIVSADPPLNYDLAIQYEHAVLMKREDIDRAYGQDVFKWDYFAFDVEIPIDELELEVTFPSDTAVTVYPRVFFGWSEQGHDAELQRCKGGFTRFSQGGRFRIPDPLVGFRYVLYWTLHTRA